MSRFELLDEYLTAIDPNWVSKNQCPDCRQKLIKIKTEQNKLVVCPTCGLERLDKLNPVNPASPPQSNDEINNGLDGCCRRGLGNFNILLQKFQREWENQNSKEVQKNSKEVLNNDP